MNRRTSIVQSVVFPKKDFSQKTALLWLMNHGYNFSKVDVTPNTYRFRQHEPSPGLSYYTKTLHNGVILVIHR